ncbi:hypothetical protein [Undibacterium macrobrachii]|uniref:SIR2-like domain-containing protein n=1 Tax=Undibacterium macrobrachii TaxID=1119058 RepID=A0ABQ2XA07_9BURK|nr:hypothetical protein [Undibacterium macrobrachii]GGX06430.1 hypothetical protein GCM10011282_11030 [Undibacterium macrobrachii]
MLLRDLIQHHQHQLALLIGNGINRYNSRANTNSWDALLSTLAKSSLPELNGKLPAGISLTEFYDVLELGSRRQLKDPQTSTKLPSLQQQFCQLMADWKPAVQHQSIARWARHFACPILTTNFEHTLSESVQASAFVTSKNAFTDFYPWETYFSNSELDHPCGGFGIWHINGMQKYHRSIRLGLTHYMGSVERARARLHKGSKRLSAGGAINDWEGANTWLQILFHKPLLIIGLNLAENEVFLRWLLIERAKYYKDFPDRTQAAWYVHTEHEQDLGKLYFLRAVGVDSFCVPDYSSIYDASIWRLEAD